MMYLIVGLIVAAIAVGLCWYASFVDFDRLFRNFRLRFGR